jgi:hypothetical protein
MCEMYLHQGLFNDTIFEEIEKLARRSLLNDRESPFGVEILDDFRSILL